jgi:prepilin-type N-terminal cleavage/methylation domain-containing protein
MVKQFNMKSKGFTFIEAVIALSVFSILTVSGHMFLTQMGDSLLETQKILKSELLAQNALIITEEIMKNEDILLWDGLGAAEDRLKYMNDTIDVSIGESADTGLFKLSWNGSVYTLLHSSDYEGPIDTYSEDASADPIEKYYRRISIKQKETWGLYEIEADICYDMCKYHTKLYKNVEKR